MLTRNIQVRRISRLMTVLFAVQVMVGGFCLLAAEAHAMPQPEQMQGLHAHCAKSSHIGDQHSQGHCDQPAQLSNATVLSTTPIALVLSGIMNSSVAPLFSSDVTGLLSSRTPTGPPRSSSLLYTVTQRIRV